ncbi:phosphatidylinositol-glycan biosynthesis class S protein [Sporodiniella umbellata]|nr:phosphatidylinositol-glycan biosynthesis class S protein [Sporodiniella umbellata]
MDEEQKMLLGLPFWWKTTQVYRASLPFSEIDEWYSKQACDFVMPTRFRVVVPIEFQINSNSLSIQLRDQIMQHIQHKNFFPVSVDVINSLENEEAPVGTYLIWVQQGTKVKLRISSERTSFLDVVDKSSIVGVLGELIPSVYLSEQKELVQIACSGEQKIKNDAPNMRVMKYASEYEIIFSLMNNKPEETVMDWEIREALSAYLEPFVQQVSAVSNFTIHSQIQNYAPLSLKPEYKERVGKPDYYYFEPQHLPHFVNSAEWNLASTTTTSPSIHFILYSPSQDESPLRIHDTQGQPLLTNAFLIPRWGGIVIKNTKPSVEYKFTKSELQPILKTFLSQLRSLIGVKDLEAKRIKGPVSFEAAKKSGITLLEKDNLIRARTLENVVNTISTLKSLGQLVDEIPNMVVQDHINHKVRNSLDHLQSSKECLKYENILGALEHSISAIELAEKAFFDPTMVSMLYFPDEHKYAIYMPLFVPTSVPLLAALVKEIKRLKKQ